MINNLIESVWNPDGRFRSLKNISPVTESGELKINSGAGYCDFEMERGGVPVRMRCYYSHDKEARERLRGVSSFLGAIDEPCYCPFTYHEEELLVFDDHGGYRYVDVSLEEIPSGRPLVAAFRSMIGNGGEEIPLYIDGLIAFALRHRSNLLLHGRLSAEDVFIDRSGQIILTGFRHARRAEPAADTINMVLIICMMILACTDRRALDLLPGSVCGSRLILPEPLSEVPGLPAGSGVPEEVKRALAAALEYDTADAGKGNLDALADVLESLKGVKTREDALFSALLDTAGLGPASGIRTAKKKPKVKYEFIGEPSDMLMRAFDGEKWCYLGRNARVAIPGPFTEAYDFYEGLAVVEKSVECWGLIDRSGNYVLEPVYHNIEMDHESNRLVLTRDGMSGLATRLGEPLTPLCYDQIISSREGIFMVKNTDRYGFISRDGERITGTVFEEADNFTGGRANVTLKGRRYVIGRDGQIIDEIISGK